MRIHEVEWTLIRYPLPLLQNVGRDSLPFLYDVAWEHPAKRSEVRAYQKGNESGFDPRVLLFPDVGESLVQLNGLLRMVVQKEWTSAVARLNAMEGDALGDWC
ncbi:MAG: hypothetical protein GY822_11400 [Deltaproteobacteria bacterium]|nr:hypothetical protein [Deltaproteobacteria bacterium]